MASFLFSLMPMHFPTLQSLPRLEKQKLPELTLQGPPSLILKAIIFDGLPIPVLSVALALLFPILPLLLEPTLA